MAPRGIFIVIAGLLLVGAMPVGASQNEVDPFGYGVLYFIATGKESASHFGFSPSYDGNGLLPFAGCGFVQARPGTENGTVEVLGLLDGTNLVHVYFDNFSAPNDALEAQGGIAVNLTLDGSLGRSGPSHPQVFARAAAWGKAFVQIDTNNFTDALPFDPEAEAKEFDAYFLLSRDGFRDNATKAVQTKSGRPYDPADNADARTHRDDWEMHMRFEAPGSGRRITNTYQSPGGTLLYEEQHHAEYRVSSREAYTGEAELAFTASTSALGAAAPTELRFRVVAPGLQTLANFTLRPDVGQDATETVAFPLSQYGDYEIEVEGRAAAASYEITASLTGPSELDFNFWWDEVSFEKPALEDIRGCNERLLSSGLAPIVGGVGRGKGPGLSVELLLVTAGVTILGVLFAVKLVSDAVVTATMKSLFQR